MVYRGGSQALEYYEWGIIIHKYINNTGIKSNNDGRYK